jgi:mannose-6-phosphate isomerase-like protein (cupin superfamily)
MHLFEQAQLREQRQRSGDFWLEFLRVPSLRVGIYELLAAAVDPQQPHTEDEIYYVVRGCGVIRVDAEDRSVQTGSVIFVPAGVEHRFHSITEDLSLLVVFARAPGSA